MGNKFVQPQRFGKRQKISDDDGLVASSSKKLVPANPETGRLTFEELTALEQEALQDLWHVMSCFQGCKNPPEGVAASLVTTGHYDGDGEGFQRAKKLLLDHIDTFPRLLLFDDREDSSFQVPILEELALGNERSVVHRFNIALDHYSNENAVEIVQEILQRNPSAMFWTVSPEHSRYGNLTYIEAIVRKHPSVAPWLFGKYPWAFEVSASPSFNCHCIGDAISNAVLRRGTNHTVQEFFDLYPQGLSSTFAASRYGVCTPLEYVFGKMCAEFVYFDPDYPEYPETSMPEDLFVNGQNLQELLKWLVVKTPRSAPIDTFTYGVEDEFQRAMHVCSVAPGASLRLKELCEIAKGVFPRCPRMFRGLDIEARYLPVYCRDPDVFDIVKTTLRLKHLYPLKHDVDDGFIDEDIRRLNDLVKEEVSIFQTNAALFQAHSQLMSLVASAGGEDPSNDLLIFVNERVKAPRARITAIRNEMEQIRQQVKDKRVQYEFDGNTWYSDGEDE